MIGIYRIRNVINDKCYYGSSLDVEKRWLRHKNELGKNKHINILLQRAWDKYGSDNFVFEMVEECDEDSLLIIEQRYLDTKPEYNIALHAKGGDNITNNPNRLQIIENITKSIKDRYESMSDEERKIKYSKPGDKNPNWRGGKTFCGCGNRINPNAKTCAKCMDRAGVNNPFYGKKHTQEYKDKASKRQKGVYKGKQNNPIMVDGIEYRSAGEASEKLGIPMTTIRWRVRSDNPKYSGYKYVN